MVEHLAETGWALFPAEDAVTRWAEHARAAALSRIASDTAHREAWLDCEGTWFVGVDTLLNDEDGTLPDGPPLSGTAYEAARRTYGALPLHAGRSRSPIPAIPAPARAKATPPCATAATATRPMSTGSTPKALTAAVTCWNVTPIFSACR